MNRAEVLALYDQQERIGMWYPEARREVLPEVVRFVRPAPGMNIVLYSRLDESNADRLIQQQVGYFLPMRQPFSWKVFGHDMPADLVQCLEKHGFALDDAGDIMVLDLNEIPPALLEPVTADIRPVQQAEQITDVVQVMEAVWGGSFSWMHQRLGSHLAIPGYLSLYVVYADNRPVSAGWTYYQPDSLFAGLWGGSTLPEYRKRGLYSALLAVRVQEAARRGRRYMVIDAGPMSRPIVARHGFQFLTSAQDYEWKGPANPPDE